MSTTTERVAKQIQYLKNYPRKAGDPLGLLDLNDLTLLIVSQSRQDPKRVRKEVRSELERLVEAGTISRWEDVHGRSLRPSRKWQYVINEI